MRKPLASLKKVFIVGIGGITILLILYMIKYESVMHSIVAWIDDLKSGH